MALHQVGSYSFPRAKEKADGSLLGSSCSTFSILSVQVAQPGERVCDDKTPWATCRVAPSWSLCGTPKLAPRRTTTCLQLDLAPFQREHAD